MHCRNGWMALDGHGDSYDIASGTYLFNHHWLVRNFQCVESRDAAQSSQGRFSFNAWPVKRMTIRLPNFVISQGL
jgi:hypothetical protein